MDKLKLRPREITILNRFVDNPFLPLKDAVAGYPSERQFTRLIANRNHLPQRNILEIFEKLGWICPTQHALVNYRDVLSRASVDVLTYLTEHPSAGISDLQDRFVLSKDGARHRMGRLYRQLEITERPKRLKLYWMLGWYRPTRIKG